MISWKTIFPPCVDETSVFIYSVSLVERAKDEYVGGQCLKQVTTWGEIKTKLPGNIRIPRKQYGVDKPVYILSIYFQGYTSHSVVPLETIEKHVMALPIMSYDEQTRMIKTFSDLVRLTSERNLGMAKIAKLQAELLGIQELLERLSSRKSN